MNESIITAIITGGLALIGTVITVLATSRKTANAMQISQAVMAEKLDSLENEVKKHNNFASEIPVLKEKTNTLEHVTNNLDRRVTDLEKKR